MSPTHAMSTSTSTSTAAAAPLKASMFGPGLGPILFVLALVGLWIWIRRRRAAAVAAAAVGAAAPCVEATASPCFGERLAGFQMYYGPVAVVVAAVVAFMGSLSTAHLLAIAFLWAGGHMGRKCFRSPLAKGKAAAMVLNSLALVLALLVAGSHLQIASTRFAPDERLIVLLIAVFPVVLAGLLSGTLILRIAQRKPAAAAPELLG